MLFHLDHDVASSYLKLKPKDPQLNDIRLLRPKGDTRVTFGWHGH